MTRAEYISMLHSLRHDSGLCALTLQVLQQSGILPASNLPEQILRIEQAVKMLDSGMSRSEIRDALQARYGICRMSAYRVIARALNKRAERHE